VAPADRARDPSSSVTLVANPEAPSKARRFLWETAGRDRQPSDELDVPALLITELVSNAVRHGSPAGGSIEVEVTVTGESLRVLVRDEGAGFDPDAAESGGGGWGIHLVRELASRWGVERGDRGGEVWFEVI
jgi:anti-sigma regulatory factor (Ser/Thr protein kinase)